MPLRQDMSLWSGRIDAVDGDAGRRWHQLVRPYSAGESRGTALLGFACDAGVTRNHGRAGAADGPAALRRALGNLAWHGGPDDCLLDAGDVACVGDALEAAQDEYATLLAQLIRTGHAPIGLGGGHEIAWGAYQGIERALHRHARLDRLGIINFDAHLDMRRAPAPGQGTSGTPFLQIAEARAAAGLEFRYLCIGAAEPANTPALLQRAATHGAEIVLDVDAGHPVVETRLREFIADSSAIYLTFCLDVLPPAVVPGVSAPSGLGIALHRAIALLREALRCCGHRTPASKLLVADIAELNPRFDPDGRTARTAARIAYEMAAISPSRRAR
jgi:formiminoglutamase